MFRRSGEVQSKMVAMTPRVKCHLRPHSCVSADLKGSGRINAENKCSDLVGVTSGSSYVLAF